MVKKVTAIFAGFLIVAIVFGSMAAFQICPPEGPWPTPPWCEPKTKIPPTVTSTPTTTTMTTPTVTQKQESKTSQPSPTLTKPLTTATTPVSKETQTITVEGFRYLEKEEIPDFFKRPVFFVVEPLVLAGKYKGENFFDKVSEVAIAWRGECFENGKVADYTKYAIRWYHERGAHYIGYTHPATSQFDVKPIIDEKFATIDLYGKLILFKKPGMSESYTKGEYWENLLDPDWQEFLAEQCKMMVDLGVEGIMFDEAAINRKIVYSGGTFDRHSMEGFREYLKSKYTQKELSEKFGINNIENFNFKDYIFEKGIEETWNKEPLPAITKEFVNFQAVASAEAIEKIVESVKEYARTKYGREILFSMNAGPEAVLNLMKTGNQDYGMGENFYFGEGATLQKAAIAVKLSEGLWKNKYLVLAEVSYDNGEIPRENNKNLFKYMFADVYSADGRLITDGNRFMTMKNWKYFDPEDFVYYDINEAAKYINFAQQHPEFYGLEEPAKVAVVHSIASRIAGARLIDVEDRKVWSEHDVKGVLQMLFNLNVPCKMIVSGDGELFKDKITKEKLDDFEIVIFPAVFMLDESEVQAVFDYAREGGKVIVVGEFATHNKRGELVQRVEVENLKNGENKVGSGIIHVISENLGERYFYDFNKTWHDFLPTERSPDDPPLKTFKEALFKYYSPEIETDAPITVNIRRYVDSERVVLHIVNYDYDHLKDEFKPLGKFQIKITLPDGVNPVSATLYDFEETLEKEIDLEVSDGKATLTVPSLYAYSVIELKK